MHLKTLLAFAALLLLAPQAGAAVRINASPAAETIVTAKQEQKEAREARREAKKKKFRERLERKRDKLARKLEKKGFKIGQDESPKRFWSAVSLILGIVLLAGGIVLGIVSLSNPLGGFFHFLAGLLIVAGIVLILGTMLKGGAPPPNP